MAVCIVHIQDVSWEAVPLLSCKLKLTVLTGEVAALAATTTVMRVTPFF